MGYAKRYRFYRVPLPTRAEVSGTNFADTGIYSNTRIMGNNSFRLRTGYQQFTNRELSVFVNSSHTGISNVDQLNKRMAEINLWKWLLTIFWVPTYFGGIWLNIQSPTENWKANILFVLGGIFAIARMVVYVIKARQDIRLREWEYDQKTKEKDSAK